MTTKEVLDTGNPNQFGDACHKIALGTILDALANPTTETGLAPVADVATLANQPIAVHKVAVTASGAGAFNAIVDPVDSGVPAAGHCAVDYANKTVTFAAADAVTAVDVTYVGFPAASATGLATTLDSM